MKDIFEQVFDEWDRRRVAEGIPTVAQHALPDDCRCVGVDFDEAPTT